MENTLLSRQFCIDTVVWRLLSVDQGEEPVHLGLVAWLRERQRMEAEYRAAIFVGPDAPAHKNAKLQAMGLAEADSLQK